MQELYPVFSGQWTLERWIYIKKQEEIHASANGTARFVPGHNHQLHYEEKGKLVIAGGPAEIPFSRSFRYAFGDHYMDVYFADGPDNGKLYQRYIPGQHNRLIPDGAHTCGNDIYQGAYHFSGADSFVLNTVIDGPRKDFLIKTQFTRIINYDEKK